MDAGITSTPTTLDSRYTVHDGPVLLSGINALVRVLLEQARLDRERGWNTGGLVSGYRGSPLGGLDQELWRQEKRLTEERIRFQPGLNEDLAATMLWGSQQLETFPGQTVEGVFGMWYGKGPGVDRSADALRCANMVGTSAKGGVLAVAGDDHAAHSSTFPHQTDQIFEAVMMPVLQPADAGEIVDFGLAGYALSRFSGLWVALKTVAETAEQAAVTVVGSRRSFVRPDIALPPHGFNYDPHLAWPADRAQSERRLLEERLPAALAWARANNLNRLVSGAADAPVGIVTVGKAHWDAVHALRRLGVREDGRVAVFKVGMSWPLETEGLAAFARGKRALLVVEEKRAFVEQQLRHALYNLPADLRPPIYGKTDLSGATLLPATMELSPELLAAALGRFLPKVGVPVATPEPVRALPATEGLVIRAPAFCAGCPHNTGTSLPEGSHAVAGIGCHIMALNTQPGTLTFSHMGGEGVGWVGMAPFTETRHMFANMGDGTYQHSGLLAIRQAVAAKANITYKILFNDAVAMTGGQRAEGGFTPADIARQVAAEGVGLVALVADDAARLPDPGTLPAGTVLDSRENLLAVQRRLREHGGVSVLIYDQVCATEKRRRRKRGVMAQADVSVAINERVCENCGDCTAQSHCIAVEPVETAYGRKRRVSPSACNTDLSCLKGFCPSFVTTSGPAAVPAGHGGEAWLAREGELAAGLPAPVLPPVPWRALFAGIGGGGIVTAGAVVAMAAHLEGRHVSTLDFTGLAQKNGAVVSHVQVTEGTPGGERDVVRIPLGEADLMLAADLAVAASAGVLDRCRRTANVVGNLDLQAGAAFTTNRDLRLDAGLHRRAVTRHAGGADSLFVRGAALAERLFGNAQAMNTVLLGMAWQQGLVPVGESALHRAMELNGTAVALNHRAFLWGRILAHNPAMADEILSDAPRVLPTPELVEQRAGELVRYGSARLARRFRRVVATAEAAGDDALTRAVAEGYFRVLAIKDEYEVARLHAAAAYGPDPVFHMAPPLLSRVDKATGRKRKVAIPGRVALPLFRVLRHGKVLRGTPLDPFGWQAERRTERGNIALYEGDVRLALAAPNRDAALALLRWPLDVRGMARCGRRAGGRWRGGAGSWCGRSTRRRWRWRRSRTGQ